MRKTYKTKGLPYYVKNCTSIEHAALVLIANKVGVTVGDLEEVEVDSIPMGATVFCSMELKWQKTEDHIYNKKVVTCDVYVLRVTKKRNVYLMDKENFPYTFSCGANSEYSFSGSFYGTSITTLEDAKEYLLKFQKSWFRDDSEALKVLKESIRL